MSSKKRYRHRSHQSSKRRFKTRSSLFYIVCILALSQIGLVVYKRMSDQTPAHEISGKSDSLPPSSLDTPLADPSSISSGSLTPRPGMNAHLLGESRVYGTWIKGLKLPENMDVELVGKQQISGSEWAIIRFNHQGQSMSGWIPAEAVASPMALKAIPVASFDDTVAVQAQPGFLPAGAGSLGISRNEMVGILSPYFPELKNLTRQECNVRISTATEDQKSSLLMRCDNDKILEVILTLSSEDLQLAQGFSQSLSGHCAATAQSMLDLIQSQESGSLECSEVCQIQVEHAPGSIWIHLKPVGTHAESG